MKLLAWLSVCLAMAVAYAAASMQEGASTIWGTYRPQLLFGMRPRMPKTLVSGLLYYSPSGLRKGAPIRHGADANQDLDTFKWTYHDGRNFGIQEIVDPANNYMVETTFVKTGHEEGSPGHWAVRLRGTVLDESKPAELLTYYYVGSENTKYPIRVNEHGEARGQTLGGYTLRVESNSSNTPMFGYGNMSYFAMNHDPRETWRGDELILRELMQEAGHNGQNMDSSMLLHALSNQAEQNSTFFAFQKTFRGNFTYDIFFDSNASPPSGKLNSTMFTQAIQKHTQLYDHKFEERFGLSKSGTSPQHVKYAREITSQLFGGIGYYYGDYLVDRRPRQDAGLVLHDMRDAEPKAEGPRALLTATPSRSFFPRGFYWDEGFHLLHISAFDPALGAEIFESWTHLIDKDGWVAREQILGEEARSKVPAEFQTQYPQHANPPTLIFGLNTLIQDYVREVEKVRDDMGGVDHFEHTDLKRMEEMHKRLMSLYEPWKRHYEWFRRTQRGQIQQWGRDTLSRQEAYRWRGRSATHVLTSGLDDYPRAAKPHVGELHVDLHSWMGFFAQAMQRFANALHLKDDAYDFQENAQNIADNLLDLHWNDDERLFCDASVDERDDSFFECHPGYVSLFPLLTQQLDVNSTQTSAVLDLLSDPDALWSPHGLRSLSLQDPFFGKGEDYWRGAIWVPINYMALRALYHYSHETGHNADRAALLYTDLRMLLIRTVLGEYERTGYTWEQFDAQSGHGRRNHPFTGWTSLIVLIMAEKYA